MSELPPVLVITADGDRRERAERALGTVAEPIWAGDLESALEAVSTHRSAAALVDSEFPDHGAIDVLSALGAPGQAVGWVPRLRGDLLDYGVYVQLPHDAEDRVLADVVRWLLEAAQRRDTSRADGSAAAELEHLHGVVAHVRHELNNPLTAILAEVQLLQMDADRFSGEHRESLETIEAMAQRMRELVKKLRELKRREG